MIDIIAEGAANFPVYLFYTIVISGIAAGAGYLFCSPLLQNIPRTAAIGLSGLSGLLIFTAVANALSYIIAPPLSLSITMVLFIGLCAVALALHRRVILSAPFPKQELLVFAAVQAFFFTFLFFATYNHYNFDEDLHRPMVATMLEGKFPVRHPVHPFWMRHFDYHYGWQMLAASFSAFFHISDRISLDLVKHSALFLGICFGWGILKHYGVRLAGRVLAIGAFLLSGPFWFFNDTFTNQYIFGITERGMNAQLSTPRWSPAGLVFLNMRRKPSLDPIRIRMSGFWCV
jgi:hypothetical protein